MTVCICLFSQCGEENGKVGFIDHILIIYCYSDLVLLFHYLYLLSGDIEMSPGIRQKNWAPEKG